jgi:hypothetical protein
MPVIWLDGKYNKTRGIKANSISFGRRLLDVLENNINVNISVWKNQCLG